MSSGEAVEFRVGAGSVRLGVWAATDIGVVRRINEDSHLAAAPFFVVADGMGGHAHGDRASQSAVAAVAAALGADAPAEPQRIMGAVAAANAAVRGIAADGGGFAGTTLAGVALVSADGGRSAHWMIVNIGDSRVYAVRGAGPATELEQLTVDHSLVRELVDAGVLSAEEAATHPDRNVVTRALGAADSVDADVWLIPAQGRQSFLVCSDGLGRELTDSQLAGIIGSGRADGADPAETLVRAAVAAGGSDNITALVIDAETLPDDVDAGPTRDRSGWAELDASRLDDTLPRR